MREATRIHKNKLGSGKQIKASLLWRQGIMGEGMLRLTSS
jgi:hypothetical protein